MYNSLLVRGDPIIYFEIDYNVKAEGDDKPSQYTFNFSKIRVVNTVSGNVTQTSTLNKVQPRTMKPEWDLREIEGIVAEFKKFSDKYYKWEISNARKLADEYNSSYEVVLKFLEQNEDWNAAKRELIQYKNLLKSLKKIPGERYEMMPTEVTQFLYIYVMGENPSQFKGNNHPVESVNWYDAVMFCNRLSEMEGLTPVYAVDGKTDTSKWNYTPHKRYGEINGNITQDLNANGYRLPTEMEWECAARGGQNYRYAGSDDLGEVGWYEDNSGKRTHEVGQKKANGYGLYDMSGNVFEWCWDEGYKKDTRICRGGSYRDMNIRKDLRDDCMVERHKNRASYKDYYFYASSQNSYQWSAPLGFRIVRNIK